MTDAQTEAQAIARRLEALAEHLTLQPLTHADDVDIATIREAATALAAKDAELAAVKVSNNKWLAKWERAEALLAEARKALEQIEVRTRSVPSDTAEDDKRDKYHANSIARRALEGDE